MTNDMKEKWKLSDPNHVLDCIEQWRNLDLRKISDDDVDAVLRSFLKALKKFLFQAQKKILLHFGVFEKRLVLC